MFQTQGTSPCFLVLGLGVRNTAKYIMDFDASVPSNLMRIV